MKKKNTIVSKKFDTHTTNVLKKIKKAISDLEKGVLTFHFGGRPVRAQKSDFVRILSNIEVNSHEELGIRNIILEAVMTSESIAAGSGYLVAKMMTTKNPISFRHKSKIEIQEIFTTIKNLIGVGLSSKMLCSTIKESSIDSDVSLTFSEMAFQPILTITPYSDFEGRLSEMFFTRRQRLESAGLLFVDGVIESVGMIDNLLQGLAREKKNLVIFARGYTPDVVNTLSKNHEKGALYVFPVMGDDKLEIFDKVKKTHKFFDIENIHLIREASVDDFDFENVVEFRDNIVKIEGIGSIRRKAHFTMPSRYKNMQGLLEDRINYGKRLSQHCAKHGVGYCSDLDDTSLFSLLSIKQSRKTYNSLKNSLENLGAMVLQTT